MKNRVLVISGPNLNMLEYRDEIIYGKSSLKDLENLLTSKFSNLKLTFIQSNYEGSIIDFIQDANNRYDAILINAAAYTHTSVAIRDALELTKILKVEVHFSDFTKREDFRKVSLLSDVCDKTFYGKKEESYIDALNYICAKLQITL